MKQEFSVLMSIYINENPEYLYSALESILDNQTLLPDEVLIIQDGPITDRLQKVVKQFKNKYPGRIRSLEISKNVGLGKALKIGVKSCKYDIIARMDADDISEPIRFEEQIKYFKNSDYDVVGSCVLEFKEDKESTLRKKSVPEFHKDILKYSKFRNPINHPSVMYNKSSVIISGNYKHMDGFEDYYLWHRMLRKECTFYNIQSSLLRFRSSDDMIKRRGGFDYFLRELKFLKISLQEGYINHFNFISSILIRAIYRISPFFLRRRLYNLLRK